MREKSDKSIELDEGLEEHIRKALSNRTGTSVEEALEKALDRTTPETPGDPRDTDTRRLEKSEWA